MYFSSVALTLFSEEGHLHLGPRGPISRPGGGYGLGQLGHGIVSQLVSLGVSLGVDPHAPPYLKGGGGGGAKTSGEQIG